MNENYQLDDKFADIASRVGGIDQLLESFFGFLHRKTDFYVVVKHPSKFGFPENKAKEILLKNFERYSYKRLNIENNQIHSDIKISDIVVNDVLNKPPAETKIIYTKDNKQVPIGNGGVCSNYYWTQTLKDLTVYVDVPNNVQRKDLIVVIKPTTLTIHHRGNVILDGRLEFVIKPQESLWTISSSSKSTPQIMITLEKVVQTWWECVILGDAKIDTSLVDSSQRIDEYDDETQSALLKIMREQRNLENS